MLHLETISPGCLRLIRELMIIPALNIFRLAGGTALALQRGHRTSIDIDLFAGQPFDNNHILMALEAHLYPERPVNVRTFPFGFFCDLFEIKSDFMFWGHEFVDDAINLEGIRMCSPLEILTMKLQAITSRKTKKDFVDIAVLLQEIPLPKALSAFEKKYPEYDYAAILKQLVYFDKAETDSSLNMLLPLSWVDAKHIISDAVKNYWQDQTSK